MESLLLKDKLELCLITYNRASSLDNTLKQFLSSPFRDCRLTVLDNFSSDDTSKVCVKYQKLFPDMQILRHRVNISGGANYLRAVEISEKPYTWIICDDDNYDFSDCNDVIQAIESEKFDLISLGCPAQYKWERGLTITPKELIEKGARYFSSYTFYPSIIFKTKLFNSECISRGYFTMGDLYPNFAFIYKAFENDYLIYVSKREIVLRCADNSQGLTKLYWYVSWVNNCANFIKDKKIKKETIGKIWERGSLFKFLVLAIMLEKACSVKGISFGKDGLFKKLAILFCGFTWEQKILLIFVLPFALIPSFVCRWLYNFYYCRLAPFFGKKTKNYLHMEDRL